MGTRGNRISGTPILKALVLDAHSRAAVETIQSLGRHGVQVDASAENGALAFSSKRLGRRLRQPPTGQMELLLPWLEQLDSEVNYSLIVPSTEGSLRHFLSLSESSRLRQKAVLSSNESLRIALDKSLTLNLASKLGVPVPDTVLIQPGDMAPICNSYPVVLKPVSSVLSFQDGTKLLQSRIARNEVERQQALDNMLQDCAVLQQELVPGNGVGVEMLYREGKPLWQFCHERLHEGSGLPGLGSGSSYRRSIAPKQELLRHAVALLDALEWHGVAMVEYKVMNDGRFWLMEINPRLWGSLALAIDAGVDFPWGLWCLATGLEISPQPDYRIGYNTRLLWRDLDWIRNRIISRPDAYAAGEILRLLKPIIARESWDFFDWGDLAVTTAEFRLFASDKIQAVKKKFARSRQEKAAYKLHSVNLRRFLESAEKPRKILFLCYGNICRSPVSAMLTRLRFPGANVQSAGFHPSAGRVSPPHIQSLARTHSIDLSSALSVRVTKDMVCGADVVFLHDMRNYDHFCGEFAEYKSKVLFLGLCGDPPTLEIKDPYNFDSTETARVLQQISAAIDSAGAKLLDFGPVVPSSV